jgi:hypothetical protein
MYTVTKAVEEIVERSDFAIEGLQTRCINMSMYANSIKDEVESLAKKPVKKGSVVVALARLADKYKSNVIPLQEFKFYNLVSRTGLVELTYPKTKETQKLATKVYGLKIVGDTQFFVSTTGVSEISFITQKELTNEIIRTMDGLKPTLLIKDLASLTLQVDSETIDTPRQSYTVIKQLALRDITLVEYVTSPSELTIIIYDKDLKESFSILYDRFFVESTAVR